MASVRPNVRTAARDKAFASLSNEESKAEFKALQMQQVFLFSPDAKIAEIYHSAYQQDLVDEFSDQERNLNLSLPRAELDQIQHATNAAEFVKLDEILLNVDIKAKFLEFDAEFKKVKSEIASAYNNYAKVDPSLKQKFESLVAKREELSNMLVYSPKVRVKRARGIKLLQAMESSQTRAELLQRGLRKLKQKTDAFEEKWQAVDAYANFMISELQRIGRANSSELEELKKQIEHSIGYRNYDARNLQYQKLWECFVEIERITKTKEIKGEAKELSELPPQELLKKMSQRTNEIAARKRQDNAGAVYRERVAFLQEEGSKIIRYQSYNSKYREMIRGEKIPDLINKQKNAYKGVGHRPAIFGLGRALKNGIKMFALMAAISLGVAIGIGSLIGWGIFSAFLLTGAYFSIRNYMRSKERTKLLQAHKNPGLEGLLQEENEEMKNESTGCFGNAPPRDVRVIFMQEAIVRCRSHSGGFLTDAQYQNLKPHGECKDIHVEQDEVPCVVNQKEGDRDYSQSRLFYNTRTHALFFKGVRDGRDVNEPLANDHLSRVEQYKHFSPPSSAPAA